MRADQAPLAGRRLRHSCLDGPAAPITRHRRSLSRSNFSYPLEYRPLRLSTEKECVVSAILAIDPGLYMGWALLKDSGKITFGQENFNQPAGRVGQRFLAFGEWLAHTHKMKRVDLIAYEKVMRHKGTFAAHAYGGFIAILTAFCEREQIDYAAVPVGTIKKHWVDDGHASKAQMMEEALGRGFKIKTDNEADALALLDYARKKYAVEQDGWITILPETK